MMLTRSLAVFVTMCLIAHAAMRGSAKMRGRAKMRSSVKMEDRSAPLCGGLSNIEFVKIPKAMSLADFDANYALAGKVLYLFYFAWSESWEGPNSAVLVNPDMRFIKDANGDYSRELAGIYQGTTPPVMTSECVRIESKMNPVEGTKLAMFMEADGFMTVHYSSCPSKYMWLVRCLDWKPGQCRCALDKAWIGLIVTSLDRRETVPWEAVVKDLKATTMPLGATDLKWWYTFGSPNNCSVTNG